jgi:hypothetical protein
LYKTLRIFLWAACGVLLIFNIYRASQKNWNYADPLDYRGLFIGGKLFMQDQPLYNDSIGGELWTKLKAEEDFESTTDFGNLYASVSLYPPQAFIPFLPLSFLKWKTARLIWWLICFLSLFVIAWISYQYTNDKLSFALILALSSTYFALSLGQPMLPVMAILLSTVFLRNTRPILAGILLGIAMIKFSIAIPFGLWYLAQKKYKMLIVGAFTSLVMFSPLLIQNVGVISDWLNKTNWYYAFMYTPHINNIYTFSDSEITMMLDYFYPRDIALWKGINAIGQIVGYVTLILLFIKKRMSKNYLILGLILVSFVFTYHLSYDALLFMVPLSLFGPIAQRKTSKIIVAFLLVLSLPISALAGDVEILRFNYSILCALGFILFIFALIKSKLVEQ